MFQELNIHRKIDSNRLCRILGSLVLIFLFQVSSNSFADSYDKSFYKKIRTVGVDVYGGVHSEGRPSLILGTLMGAQFPISHDELSKMLVDALRSEIHGHDNITVLTPSEFGKSYDSAFKIKRDQMYIHADLIYWSGSELSPKIDRDVVVVTMKTKRVITGDTSCGTSPSGQGDEKTIEKDYSPILMSVPENSDELAASVRSVFKQFVRNHIIP